MPFDDPLERVKAALKSEGFGMLAESDQRATPKQKTPGAVRT